MKRKRRTKQIEMLPGQNRKQRGRSNVTHVDEAAPTKATNRNAQMTQVNRAVTASGNGNKHRGDRRDMSPTYTGNDKHRARGNTPRRDVSTRKR